MTDPNEQDFRIHDENHPQSLNDIKEKEYPKLKRQIAESLLNYFTQNDEDDYFRYYICSTDEQDRKFITTQNNQNVK